jgi:hypothetical protein
MDVAAGGELDEDLGARTLRRAADGDQPLEIGASRPVEHRLGVLRELRQLDDGWFVEDDLGLVHQGAHRARADQGQAIERRERASGDPELGGPPVDQQLAPAVGKAIVEHAHQAVQDIGPAHHDAGPQWQLER